MTPRSITRAGHPALKRLTDAGYEVVLSSPGRLPDEAELMQLLPDCVGYLAGVEKISAPVLSAAPRLRVISRNGTGVDNIDLEAADRGHVRICRAEGANARGVAELTMGLLFSLLRGLSFSDRCMKEGRWERREGIELEGRTLGLVGCGRIGKLVVEFALGFGMKVRAYDLIPDRTFDPSPLFEYTSRDALWGQCDVISLHCPPHSDSAPLINALSLGKMRRGTYLINTARAELLDESAVLDALDDGVLAGVATDVFRAEPPTHRPLIVHPRVIATPHVGGYTEESVRRATETAVDHLLKALVETAPHGHGSEK